MSTAFNRRRGAAANKPRNVRRCNLLAEEAIERGLPMPVKDPFSRRCAASVSPSVNGNRCEDHQK